MSSVTAYIGLGSNLCNPLQQVSRARQTLATLAGCREAVHSSLYRSDPVGPPGQPDYINAVTRLETRLDPLALLDRLQAIEQAHNRVRKTHWGPRTLDLDLLLYDDRVIDQPRLQVPHPRLAERSFVLYPLAELNPRLTLPDGTPLQRLLHRCPMGSLQRVGV